jgi:hypothetical protein
LYEQFLISGGKNANKTELADDGYKDPKTSSYTIAPAEQ